MRCQGDDFLPPLRDLLFCCYTENASLSSGATFPDQKAFSGPAAGLDPFCLLLDRPYSGAMQWVFPSVSILSLFFEMISFFVASFYREYTLLDTPLASRQSGLIWVVYGSCLALLFFLIATLPVALPLTSSSLTFFERDVWLLVKSCFARFRPPFLEAGQCSAFPPFFPSFLVFLRPLGHTFFFGTLLERGVEGSLKQCYPFPCPQRIIFFSSLFFCFFFFEEFCLWLRFFPLLPLLMDFPKSQAFIRWSATPFHRRPLL